MKRISIASFTITCMFALLMGGVFYLGIIKGNNFRELSKKNSVRLLPQEGSRGKIIDREQETIVDSSLCYDLFIMSTSALKLGSILERVGSILGERPAVLKAAFRKNFISSSAVVPIARNIDLKKAIALEQMKSSLDGVVILPRPQRTYPFLRTACHVMGYINEIDRWRLTKLEDYGYKTRDMVGFGGIEEKYDYYLRQEEGGLSIEVDSRGRLIRSLGFESPRNGKQIQLTLDLKIQKIAEESLGDKKGAVVVMDPYTGEILAMASFPNFDPAAFVNKDNAYLQTLFSGSDAPLLNRAISAAYPAGSVFKLVVASAALESGKINPGTTFYCPGKLNLGQAEFKCWDTHYDENLIQAIAHSCNVFFYHTGLLVGPEAIHEWAVKFGFSKPTNINLPYEISGFVPNPLWRKIYRLRNWYDGDTLNFSIGQGDLMVTPIQVARMGAVFANGGYLVTPYIVKGIDGRDVSSYYRKSVPLHLKASTLQAVKTGLRSVVTDPKGTANVLSGLPVGVAGKTGSAQAPPGLAHGWFIGYLPYNNPKFVICVFLEHGSAGYYATLVARQMIEKMEQEGIFKGTE